MREETKAFTKEKYFNGHRNKRSIEENWSIIKVFLLETTKNNVPTKTTKGRQSLPWINNKIKSLIK